MSVLSARGLRKSYGALEVVAGIDLAVEPGECFGLLGPNGAGKTTTLKLCLGLIEPDAGEIELLGEPVPRRARQARMRVGVVPQFDNLDPDFTVEENLVVYGRYFGLPQDSIKSKVPGLLEFAGLTGREGAKIMTLSGGMKRRLTLARALVNEPQLVFMDEPTTGLDPQARHLIWERLRRLTQEGKTLVLTTHFMEEAERLCHRLAIMDRGRIIAEGPPSRLLKEHFDDVVLELPREEFPGDTAGFPLPLLLAGDRLEISTGDVEGALRALLDRGVPLRHLRIRPRNLEDLFLELTGRELRT